MTEPRLEGHAHPISQLIREAVDIFTELGFSVAEGPELESELFNFGMLNFPKDHPARDMHDTFWLKPRAEGMLLRTHTSPVQIHYMREHRPPIATIVPGKVYRYEALDGTHEFQFHQLEGLAINQNLSLADLKGTLERFFERLYGRKIVTRFRPSFFPFVEPGVEIDMSCFRCGGTGMQGAVRCSLCKQTGWIEIMGAGMVHPNVLNGVGIDPRYYQGFAFGVGLERLAMLKYGIDDIRHFNSGDLRFINQF
ncbi:MAG: phenylalanine--tRNA ligase subunit alpha [Patescibacteria group bacterium]